MKFLSFLTAFTGRNTPWFLPFNLLLTTLAKSQSSKKILFDVFYYLRVAGVSKRISWGSDWGMFLLFANFISPICSYCLENQWSKMEKKRGWIDIFILQKKACAMTQMFCNYATNCEVSRSRKFQTSFSKTHKNRYSLQPCLRWIPFGQQLSCGEDKTWTWRPWTGCKENYFYSLPFGQAEASIY